MRDHLKLLFALFLSFLVLESGSMQNIASAVEAHTGNSALTMMNNSQVLHHCIKHQQTAHTSNKASASNKKEYPHYQLAQIESHNQMGLHACCKTECGSCLLFIAVNSSERTPLFTHTAKLLMQNDLNLPNPSYRRIERPPVVLI